MRRRDFMGSLGLLGSTVGLSTLFPGGELVRRAAAAPQLDRVEFAAPPVMPQVINVFLYGGASELAGNLTNIGEIARNSQNPYPDSLLRPVGDNGGRITRNGFWSDAGGDAMEEMLASGDMTVYRTVNRRKNNTRAHRPSIFSCLTGNLDIDNSPGMGTTLAAVLYRNSGALGKPLDQMVLPFVSFEGESTAYLDDPRNPLPLQLRAVSLDQQFDNPYSRKDTREYEAALEELVRRRSAGSERSYPAAFTAFENRSRLEGLIGRFAAELSTGGSLPVLPEGDVDAGEDGRLRYPDTRYTARIRAAVTLAIANPDTLFITVGGGIGGWDDHNAAIEEYTGRMQDLMLTLRAATKHIRYATRPEGTGNIIINVFGDFGRNVNLNNSLGWDHGNNQNLYTFGGAAIRPAGALGKVVGKTELFGRAKQNRQFTRPTGDSYQFEPTAIAATLYSWFGVRNPQVLTRDERYSPAGEDPIDETVAGEPPLLG